MDATCGAGDRPADPVGGQDGVRTLESPPARCRRGHSCSDVGWRGRIRTFDLLIQSQAPYRLATRQWTGSRACRSPVGRPATARERGPVYRPAGVPPPRSMVDSVRPRATPWPLPPRDRSRRDLLVDRLRNDLFGLGEGLLDLDDASSRQRDDGPVRRRDAFELIGDRRTVGGVADLADRGSHVPSRPRRRGSSAGRGSPARRHRRRPIQAVFVLWSVTLPRWTLPSASMLATTTPSIRGCSVARSPSASGRRTPRRRCSGTSPR